MKLLLTVIISLNVLSAFCQDDTLSLKPDAVLYTITDTKTAFKVSTDYPCIFDTLIHTYGDNGELIKSYNVFNKKDRVGKFRHFVIYFSTAGIKPEVANFLRSLAK